MSTSIATRDGEVLLSATEVELVKKTVAAGATDDELRLFLHDCRRQGVHPLDKLIHFTKRGGRYTPITSIDFMRMRAADTGELAGNDDPTYVFKDGETTIPQSATVTVHRITQGQRFAYTATARWAEYKPAAGQDHMWLKMPQLMLGKCAEALALRKAFPKQLHGIYERAEMMQAGKEDEGGDVKSHTAKVAINASTRRVSTESHDAPVSSGAGASSKLIDTPISDPEDHLEESETLFPKPDEDRTGLIQSIRVLQAKLGMKGWMRVKSGIGIETDKDLDDLTTNDLNVYKRHLEESAAK
jgi:phage recombination protein Bet